MPDSAKGLVSAGDVFGWKGMVASVDCGEYARSKIEGLANARLISAAPELLELVEAAFQWIDAVPKNTPLPSMPGIDRDWANSIIAKAKGQP